MAEQNCGCCGAKLEPRNGPDTLSGETWAHPVAECPWSNWEGLTMAQVVALGRITTLQNLTFRLAEDLDYLAESTELDDSDRRHIEEMQQLISDTQVEVGK
ncbi:MULTISPECIES: hypothetical protein [Aeromonas]|uniref:Uncharacterized protein n=4 Tax=Aeromonas TaxID=642 RepID=A0A5F0KBQ9_9GAMM|nr:MULTISPECIES: hypothetical protein [Aeromonas]AUZ78141.1 hypothetical protein C2U40_25505 [Aeromonas sp. ASNIH4]ELB2793518.1 hypothetical protein [Aeromonas hydrophila]MBS2783222.1 hypothetical protein [Aeromonas salmonicida]MDH1506071.1 hypothetical protein [Aeromonas caviae]MDH1807032.1 hypothetical protein [Aeromonas caviae]